MELVNKNLMFSNKFVYNSASLATSQQASQRTTKTDLFYDPKEPKTFFQNFNFEQSFSIYYRC